MSGFAREMVRGWMKHHDGGERSSLHQPIRIEGGGLVSGLADRTNPAQGAPRQPRQQTAQQLTIIDLHGNEIA